MIPTGEQHYNHFAQGWSCGQDMIPIPALSMLSFSNHWHHTNPNYLKLSCSVEVWHYTLGPSWVIFTLWQNFTYGRDISASEHISRLEYFNLSNIFPLFLVSSIVESWENILFFYDVLLLLAVFWHDRSKCCLFSHQPMCLCINYFRSCVIQ